MNACLLKERLNSDGQHFLRLIKSDLYFDFYQIIYNNFENKIHNFSIEIEVKSCEYLLISPLSIIKCQDVRIREYLSCIMATSFMGGANQSTCFKR